MCSKYEHLGLDELVGPELVATADASAQPDLYQGRTFRVLHMAHAKVASSLLLYRGGELGNHLRTITSTTGLCHQVAISSALTHRCRRLCSKIQYHHSQYASCPLHRLLKASRTLSDRDPAGGDVVCPFLKAVHPYVLDP